MWIAERDIRADAQTAAEDLGIGGHVFVGTGALVTPSRRRGEPFGDVAMRAISHAAATAGSRLPDAFREWVEWSESLRTAWGSAWLDAGMREAWHAAARALQEAIKRGDREGT